MIFYEYDISAAHSQCIINSNSHRNRYSYLYVISYEKIPKYLDMSFTRAQH